MLLKKLIINNLRSYENQEIIFPKGSTLLSGDIGSGKTTILLAVEFALFGLQPSQKAASLLRNDKEEGKVVLELEIEGKNVVIEKTLKRGKKSITQDYTSITIDNEKYEESVTEIKSKILKLLNYPSEFSKKTNLLYKFTVYTPQEEMKQIILESPEVRLNILRHVFGIDKYKRIEENVNILIAKLREKARVNEIFLRDLDKIKEAWLEKERFLASLIEKQKETEQIYEKAFNNRVLKEEALKEVQEKINEKNKLENEREKHNILITEKKRQIINYDKNLDSLEKEIREARKLKFSKEEYSSLNERINYQNKKESELQKEYVEIVGKSKSLESKKIELKELVKKVSGLEKCPTCLQQVSEEYKKIILDNVGKELQDIDFWDNELNAKKKTLIESIEMTRKTKEDFLRKKSELDILKVKLENINEKEERVNEIQIQKRALEKEINIINEKISAIDNSINEFEKYDLIFNSRGKELEDAREKENLAKEKKIEIVKDIQFLELQIKEKKQEIEEKEKLKKQTEKIKELEDWVSEKFLNIVLFTEKQVMITLKEEFSNLFSKWFSVLVSEALTARIDDDFSPVITQQDYELDYSFLSGGERTAVALAYRLALNQVINSLLSNIKTSNIIILDEPTDGFSSQQLEKMREVLRDLNAEQLILVSHEQRMEDFVENIIRVKKENGISLIG